MPRWLTAVLAPLLTLAAKLAGPLASYLAGRRAARQERMESDLEARDDQMRDAADRPRGRDDLVDRLRRHGL